MGRWQWLSNPTHPKEVKPITEQRIRELEQAIAQLPLILGEKEKWVLSGGLVIALVGEEYYRDHFDIDIGIHEVDLEAVVKSAEKKKYTLATRTFMGKILGDKKIDVYEKLTPEKAIKEGKKNLRLVKEYEPNGDIVRHENILDYFDVYLHRCIGTDIISNEGDLVVPATYNFGGILHYTANEAIRLRSLRYLEVIKSKLKNPKDKLDLKIIRELIAARETC